MSDEKDLVTTGVDLANDLIVSLGDVAEALNQKNVTANFAIYIGLGKHFIANGEYDREKHLKAYSLMANDFSAMQEKATEAETNKAVGSEDEQTD